MKLPLTFGPSSWKGLLGPVTDIEAITHAANLAVVVSISREQQEPAEEKPACPPAPTPSPRIKSGS